MNGSSSNDRALQLGRFEQRTLLETGRDLIESQDPAFILNNLLLISLGKLRVSSACIIVHRPGEDRYVISKGKGRFSHLEGQILTHEPEIGSLKKGVYHSSELPELFEGLELSKDAVMFHLRTSTHHIGFLCIEPTFRSEAITTQEQDFIENLCLITSATLSSSRMFEELKKINRRLDRKVHDLDSLFELSKDFNQMQSIDELSRTMKFALLGQLFVNRFLFLFKEGGQARVLVQSGLQIKAPEHNPLVLFDIPRVMAVESMAEFGGNRSSKDELEAWATYLSQQKIHYVLPVQSQGETLGVIGIGNKSTGQALAVDELDFVLSLANLVVLNIKRIQLLQEQLLNQQFQKELELARTIQEGLLPKKLPTIEGLDVAAINIPSKQIGGDYFDLFRLNDGGHLLSIADVTGKGVPAALLMANLQAMIHALALQDTTLEAATGTINDFIYTNTPADKFITFFWTKIEADGKTLKFVNAGHDHPIVFRSNKTDSMDEPNAQVEQIELKEGGLLLGALPTLAPYTVSYFTLEANDVVIFFTDGVTEAMHPTTEEEYSLKRLKKVVLGHLDKTAEEIKNAIISEVNEFSNHIRFDDLTLIVVKKE